MNSFIKRHQIIILSVILCLFSLNMALTGKKRYGGAAMVEGTVARIISPFQMAFISSYNAFGNSWDAYIDLVGLKEANEALSERVAKLTEETNRMRELESENKRLKHVLKFKEEVSFETVGAKILAFNLAGWTKTIKLNKGASDGIREDMPVISTLGVIGRIITTTASASTALLITDPRSTIDVIVQRTRIRGVAEGNGTNGLILKYIRDLDDVAEGDLVVTAGLSGIFPRGLVVGRVTTAEKSGDNFFKRIEIRPNTALKTLEEVLIAQVTFKEEE